MIIGYARVSTLDENPNLQKDALENAGCEKIFIDRVSGTVAERPGLNKIKDILSKGDVLVVWRLDRLGRSLRDLIEWITYLEKEQVALKSIQESIDTSTDAGVHVFHMFAALAEFEKNLIKERTHAGLTAARARGRAGGRPAAIDDEKKELAISLYNERKTSIKDICEIMKITKPTLYKYIRESQKQAPKGLKQMTFHNSFEEQRVFGQLPSIEMTPEERIKEMYRLNRKIYGENYGKLSKDIEIFKALPGESVNDFYKRINSNG